MSQHSEPRPATADAESARTVVTACAANLLIAVAKIVAAVLTGSAALWAEAAHSLADTGNEVLLYVGLRKSARGRDRRHPFGYGQERYFWSLLASLGIFVVGGLLSIGEGVRSFLAPEPLIDPWIGIVVLVVAGGFEGYSWTVARRQLRDTARRTRRSMVEHLRRASDPSATTVYLEDSAALVGIGLAMAALVLHLLTGWALWDALASTAIGLLLIAVAFLLARRSKALLIDESAPEDVLQPIRDTVAAPGWVAGVVGLDAVFIGPGQLLVIATVAVSADLAGASAFELIEYTERLRQQLLDTPVITEAAVIVAAGAPIPPVPG